MRALVCKQYGPPSSLVLEDMESPRPGPDEVLIDVAAAGVNFPDLLIIAGEYQVKTPPPFVPGAEVAGIAAAVGSNVDHVKVGDRIMGATPNGAFAEQRLMDARLVAHVPDGMSLQQAAGFLVTYGTSYHALKQCTALQEGETLLVLGAAGGVGIAAVEIGKAMGARVIAAASSDDKLEFARQFGADDVINYSEQSLRDEIKRLTDGNGVDVVYDPVGGELSQQALRGLAWHGRLLVVGFASGDIPSFPANLALLKEASIQGVWWGTWSAKNPAEQIRNMQALGALFAAGKIKPQVTESYPLDRFEDAFAAIAERRAKGKVTLTMD
ncbi:MAG: NADPH:quinone oxidoreductase family protein [Woeseiaceae bacterium]